MPPAEYLPHDRAIPHFATRVADFLATLGAQSA
jgi:hypothetical protein